MGLNTGPLVGILSYPIRKVCIPSGCSLQTAQDGIVVIGVRSTATACSVTELGTLVVRIGGGEHEALLITHLTTVSMKSANCGVAEPAVRDATEFSDGMSRLLVALHPACVHEICGCVAELTWGGGGGYYQTVLEML